MDYPPNIHQYSLYGQYVGIREIVDANWLVSLIDYDLGFFDEHEIRVESVANNPFAPNVLPMSSE